VFGSHFKDIFYRKRENFSLFEGGKIAEVLILPSFMTYELREIFNYVSH